MVKTTEKAVFFDFDSTLTRFDTYLLLVLYARFSNFCSMTTKNALVPLINFGRGKITNTELKLAFVKCLTGT